MSILEHYTLNDCCTGEPVVINNFEPQFNGQILYLTYDGDCVPGFCPGDLENLIITNITNEVGLNFEGCFVLTQINELPEGVLDLEYENVIFGVQTVPLCEDCQECPQQCYGLLACEGIYDLIISSDPGLSGYVDTFVNIDITNPVIESPQTLFLVKDLGVIDCQEEYTFTYSASTGSCDCQCYIFKTPSEVFITSFVDCGDNLLQVYLPTGKTTSICSLVRPIFDTTTSIPVKLGGLCISGECPDQPVVTIKPRNECDVLTIFPMGATCLVTHPSTITSFDGEAQLIVTGGTPPYTISWEVGSVSPVINNLNVGSYSATITDFYNDFTLNTTCVLTAETPTTTTTTTTPPLPTYDSICVRIIRKSKVGKVETITYEDIPLNFSGYTNGNPYWDSNVNQYSVYWNTGSTPSYWDLSGLTGGISVTSYTTQVPPLVGWNAYGDPTIQSVIVTSGACSTDKPLIANATSTEALCGNNGTITIVASGGDGIYQYSINNGTTFGTINIFQNLAPGTYIVHVKDGTNTTVVIQNVVVTQAQAPQMNLNLQVTSSNINGNTFTITPNIPQGYTVSFDLNFTSTFTYYQDPLPPPPYPAFAVPTYNNIFTLTSPALGQIPQVGPPSFSSTPVIGNPNCTNPGTLQFTEVRQYSITLTMTAGQTITGTFTDQLTQSNIQTKCKFADGSFIPSITGERVLNCACCHVTSTINVTNEIG